VGERGQGKMALITGASSGIGAAFARRLAALHYDLILVSRREERLAALADELESMHLGGAGPAMAGQQPGEAGDAGAGIVIRCLAVDLSEPEGVRRVEQEVASLPALNLLISSAGFGARGDFAESDIRRQNEMIQLHVVAATRLTRAVLPGMLRRGQGGIVNVASLAAFAALPGDAVYNATKAYLVSFTRTLHEELRGSGVRVQALCPGFTRTELHSAQQLPESELARIPAFLWSSADEVVDASLRALAQDRVICVPGWKNRAILMLARLGVVNLLLRAAL
jgi:short-subunit dehydrogenase